MRNEVEAVFKDISVEDDFQKSKVEESESVKNSVKEEPDRLAFVVSRPKMSRRKRREICQVVFLLVLIFSLLILTGILFYVPA